VRECQKLKQEVSDITGVDYNLMHDMVEESKVTLIKQRSDTSYYGSPLKKRVTDEDY